MVEKSLIDRVSGAPKSYGAKAVVERHYEEIKKLLENGYFLKDIYKHICDMYQEDIKSKKLRLSQANFYKIWTIINKPDTGTEKKISKEKKSGLIKSPPKEWDSGSPKGHPFLSNDKEE